MSFACWFSIVPDSSQGIKNTTFQNSVNSLIYSVLIVPEPPRELSCFYCSRTPLGTIGNNSIKHYINISFYCSRTLLGTIGKPNR